MSQGKGTAPRSRPMVGSALARMVESSEPMNTGSRIPHTICCASRWVSGGAAGAVAAGHPLILHCILEGRRAALAKRWGRAYLPARWGAQAIFVLRTTRRVGLSIPRKPTHSARRVTQSNGFLADFCSRPVWPGTPASGTRGPYEFSASEPGGLYAFRHGNRDRGCAFGARLGCDGSTAGAQGVQ